MVNFFWEILFRIQADFPDFFDLVLDYGYSGCVTGAVAREKYKETLLKLTQPGSQYYLIQLCRITWQAYKPRSQCTPKRGGGLPFR